MLLFNVGFSSLFPYFIFVFSSVTKHVLFQNHRGADISQKYHRGAHHLRISYSSRMYVVPINYEFMVGTTLRHV